MHTQLGDVATHAVWRHCCRNSAAKYHTIHNLYEISKVALAGPCSHSLHRVLLSNSESFVYNFFGWEGQHGAQDHAYVHVPAFLRLQTMHNVL